MYKWAETLDLANILHRVAMHELQGKKMALSSAQLQKNFIEDDLNDVMKRALLGYQPFFLKNGIVLGTGMQFFHSGTKKKLSKTMNRPTELANHKLGNIYIPFALKNQINIPVSDFYLPIAEENKADFFKYNRLLLNLYKYLVEAVFGVLEKNSVEIKSVTELGGNTGLFGSLCLEHVNYAINADIVDYSDALKVIEKYCELPVPYFHKIESLRSADIANIPVSDLGWSYAVAVHQSNPMIHICDLSSVSKKACLFMTPIGEPGELDQNQMLLKFKSSNTYYQTTFPNDFDITIMSDALIRHSLQKVGFSKIKEIKFPDFIPKTWSKQHKCYLAIRDEYKAPSIFEFSREPERDGYETANPDQITLSRQGVTSNLIRYQNHYYVVPRGVELNDKFLNNSKKWSNLNQALNYLE